MRIFVTGGSGFIGRHLLEAIAEHDLLVLSRQAPPQGIFGTAKWLKGEISDPRGWEEELIKFDPKVCVNLAWEGLPSYTREDSERNIYLTDLFIESLRKTNIKQIIVAGSCWEYGNSTGKLTETTLLAPESHFARAKLEAHRKFEDYCKTVGSSLIWVRIFFSYGPGQRTTSLLPTVFYALKRGESPIIRSPEIIQDFIHISDVANAFALFIETEGMSGVFNLGSGVPTSVAEFVNIVADSVNSSFRLQVPDTLNGFWASIDKIENALAWVPKVSLEDGIARTLRKLEASNSK